MMNYMRRIAVWLRRMPNSRGFGVQSPSAYRFIRYVISEHYPYYAYAELRHAYPSVGWLRRKRMELYFRMANFMQADVMLDCGDDSDLLRAYVERGCRRTSVVEASCCQTVEQGREPALPAMVGWARICPAYADSEQLLDSLMSHAHPRMVLVVEDICTSDVARRMWHHVLESEAVSVSYDLYYLGVAFFDTKRHKTNYKVNF